MYIYVAQITTHSSESVTNEPCHINVSVTAPMWMGNVMYKNEGTARTSIDTLKELQCNQHKRMSHVTRMNGWCPIYE